MIVTVVVLYDNGKWDEFLIDANPAGTRAVEQFYSSDFFQRSGRVVAILADVKGSAVKRGEYWMDAFIRRGQDDTRSMPICSCYVTSDFFGGLGFFEPNLGGEGFLSWRAVAADIAPADITEALAIASTQRKVRGFVWYYHASGDVADRTIVVNLRTPGPALPTGISTGGTTTVHTFPYAGAITLSANQEGMIYILDNFAMSADNASRTFENTSIKQTGFPMKIPEDDLIELLFNVTDEEAADRHSIYILQEEWLQQ